MQSNISTKNENHYIMVRTCFLSFVFQRLSQKNENWTFLKMSKSAKNSREFEKIILLLHFVDHDFFHHTSHNFVF